MRFEFLTDFLQQSKAIYDFVLVNSCDLSSILHRFRAIELYIREEVENYNIFVLASIKVTISSNFVVKLIILKGDIFCYLLVEIE